MGGVPTRRTRSRRRPARKLRPLRSGAGLVVAIVVGLVFSASAEAAPGELDPTFSGDGRQTTVVGCFGEGGATGVTIQPDGKIVAVGTTNVGGSHTKQFALARYNPNGSLDTSFSGDGKQETGFGGDFSEATAVALQADGKIVAVGADDDSGDFAIARDQTTGSLDTRFSGGGRRRTNFGGSDAGNGVALQGDGRIVAVGAGNGEFALARYLGG